MAMHYDNFDDVHHRDDELALVEDRGFFSYFSKDDLIFSAVVIVAIEVAIMTLIKIW